MKRFWVVAVRNLIAVLIIIGVAVALPAAHTGALHTPHTAHGSGASDHDCSLAACSALALEWTPSLFVLVSLVIVLVNLRPILRVHVPRLIDPPPRFACV